jgi:phage terminase large subunit
MHQIEIPSKLIPVFIKDGEWNLCRYKLAYGGRGSGKTRTFAKMTAARGISLASEGKQGIILCGRELQNSLDESSFAEIKFSIQEDEYLSQFYDCGEKYIRTKCGSIQYVFQGLRHNIDSIKSKSRILILWVDEAEPVTDECWRKVVPTVREQDSEIWITWNPERKGSPTDQRFRQDPPKDSIVVEINWRDNPWWHLTSLEQERLDDKEKRPDTYGHVWEGEYLEVKPGSYYTKHIIKARAEGRWLVDVPENPLKVVRLYADIGGTGAKSDNFVFWASQIEPQKINYLNHYESQGQDIAHHLTWLRSEGYTPDRAKIWLPHDGETNDKVIDINYRKAFEDAGYPVVVVPNQGKGAAKQRIEQTRNLFHKMWFSKKCESGCSALAYYSAKIDDKRGIDLGPNHDWASHSADSHGLSAICFEEPRQKRKLQQPKIGMA